VGFDKTGTRKKPAQVLYIHKFLEEPALCPYLTLFAYLQRRPISDSNSLFISLKSNKAATIKEVVGWLSDLMLLGGVPDNFRPHSIRGAATSKAQTSIPTETILEAANWSQYSTFKKFYLRTVNPVSNKRRVYQNAVLM